MDPLSSQYAGTIFCVWEVRITLQAVAAKRLRHIHDSHGQVLALTFREKLKLFNLRSEAATWAPSSPPTLIYVVPTSEFPIVPSYPHAYDRSSPSSLPSLIFVEPWSESPIVPSYPHYPHGGGWRVMGPLSSQYGTYKTVKARFWPWLSGKS